MARKLVSPVQTSVSVWNILITVLLLIILCIVTGIVIIYFKKPIQPKDIQPNIVPDDRICMTKSEYTKLIDNTSQKSEIVVQDTISRDQRVLSDQLYPPLNRTNTVIHDALEHNIQHRNMYVPTNDMMDNYRLIGYLVNQDDTKDAGGNNWKLFARQKDRNRSDFYIIPSNNNYDIKIHISDEMIQGNEKLRDVYTVPKQISFNTPMLNTTAYQYVEIPKADLTTGVRYL
uniref:Uncharacterized protein n=1 Tax=viral metagenome TaxID=1070528 RepID=A0A6C0BF47_9ZZZZ